jgi:O-antigen/teichoic acid export membrane protein
MPTPDVVAETDAGGRALRGGIARLIGYGINSAATAAVSVMLLRHLGVADFGRYVSVVAIVAVVAAASDFGLTILGQQEYVLLDRDRRRTLLGELVGVRLALAPIAIGAAAALAGIAGYSAALVGGAVIASGQLFFTTTTAALLVPLSAELRLGAVATVETVRQLALVAALAMLVLGGAGLTWLFAAYLPAGAAGLAASLVLLGKSGWPRLSMNLARWGTLLRRAAPIAAATILNVVYLRGTVIVVSLFATAHATGVFATSYRVTEVFLAIPMMLVGAAFPILAHAGAVDEGRLVRAMQDLFEAALLASTMIAVALFAGAHPLIATLGGEPYADASGVLRIHAFVLVGAFGTQVWSLGLLAVGQRRALVAINIVAGVVALASAAVLVPRLGAKGGALASVAGETALALAALVLLVRARPALRPDLRRAGRIVLAAAGALSCSLLPLSSVTATGIAVAVNIGLVVVLRAYSPGLVRALDPRRARSLIA